MGRRRKDAMPSFSDSESPAQRNCANERERDRMRVLSKAFTKLKTTLPWVPPDTKLSKLDTLRLATCYIAHLRQILAEDEPDDISALGVTSAPHDMDTDDCLGLQNGGQFSCDMTVALRSRPEADNKVNSAGEAVYAHPLSLTWPFNFNGRYNVSVSTHDMRAPIPQVTRSDRSTHTSHTSSAVTTQKVHMSR